LPSPKAIYHHLWFEITYTTMQGTLHVTDTKHEQIATLLWCTLRNDCHIILLCYTYCAATLQYRSKGPGTCL